MKNISTCTRTLSLAKFPLLGLALSAIALSSAAQAGTITTASSVSGTGLGTGFVPAIFTPSPGNDNQPGGPGTDGNLVVAVKRFDNAGYIDIQFTVQSSDGGGSTTEYPFFESVDNNTGVNWSAYTLQLGSGVGPGFTQSPAGDGLDFDFDTFDTAPTSAAFSSVTLGQDLLFFSGGVQGSGAEVYTFRVDVPDGIQTFTLRQTPTLVPEPSTLVLGAIGACAGLGLAWRRKRTG